MHSFSGLAKSIEGQTRLKTGLVSSSHIGGDVPKGQSMAHVTGSPFSALRQPSCRVYLGYSHHLRGLPVWVPKTAIVLCFKEVLSVFLVTWVAVASLVKI